MFQKMDKKIITILKNDGVGVYPTDTLYGIVGSALSRKAVKRIYDIKGRDENKPFIILIADVLQLEMFLPHSALMRHEIFLKKNWPGQVSVILPCGSKSFTYLHRNTNSLAFRLPKSKSLRDFLQKTGPLVAPSANPQGEEPAYTIKEAKKYFGEKVDFYVNEGKKVGKPSTVVSLVWKIPKIIRQGETKISISDSSVR